MTRLGVVRHLFKLGVMLALRHGPVPWAVKRRAIWWATAKAVLVSVAVITNGDGRVLMLRARYSGRWLLPVGALNAGEDPLAGVLRECREELAAAVTVLRLTGIYADRGGREMFFVFRCAPLASPPSLSEEHEAWRYLAPVALRPSLRRMVRDALAEPTEVRIARL